MRSSLRCSAVGCVAVVVAMSACAPAPRTGEIVFDGADAAAMGGTAAGGGGGARSGGKGGAGAGSGGGMGAAGGAPGIGSDAGSTTDAAASADAPGKLDSAAKMDAAAKLDAAPKLDTAPAPSTVLKGDVQNCSPAATAAADMIADFESGVLSTLGAGDRAPASGAWLVADGSAGTHSATVVSEARCASTKHAVYAGSGFTVWGSVIIFDFVGGSQPGPFYNASAYKGISFYARASTTVQGRVKFSDKNTANWAGVCKGDAQCNDHWGRNVEFGPAWKRYTLNFNALDQQRPNIFGPFLATQTSGMELVVFQNQAFQIALDDITFIK